MIPRLNITQVTLKSKLSPEENDVRVPHASY
jgi:hypothetical protein